MRKKEVRWISRDSDGNHDIWFNKPYKSRGTWWGTKDEPNTLENRSRVAYEFVDNVGIIIAASGLAKVTIERQY